MRYRVSGAPDGWSMRNVIRCGLPAAGLESLKPASWYVRAAPIVICGGEDELQPASATASKTAIAAGLTNPLKQWRRVSRLIE